MPMHSRFGKNRFPIDSAFVHMRLCSAENRTWLDVCYGFAEEVGVDPDFVKVLSAFHGTNPRGGRPPPLEKPFSGGFSDLEEEIVGRFSMSTWSRRLAADLAEDVDPAQADMFVRRLIAVEGLWPQADPFATSREVLIAELRRALGKEAGGYDIVWQPEERYRFRYRLNALPGEMGNAIGTSTLLAAWNAAVYVAQIEDSHLEQAIASGAWVEATRKVLRRHGGLWFENNAFCVIRVS